MPAVRRHDHLFAPIESLASLDFGENRITNTDLSNPADPALKKVIVDPGYEFELVTTLFKNRPDVSIVTEEGIVRNPHERRRGVSAKSDAPFRFVSNRE